MTLIQKLEEAVRMGYEVSFKPSMLHFRVDVHLIKDDKKYKRDNAFPMDHHFSENRIVGVIDWSMNEITKQFLKDT